MKQNFIAKKLVGIGSIALLTIAMSGVATAETFNATATVETSIAITKVDDMDFGTLFATTALGTAVAGAEACASLALAPDGTFGSIVECEDTTAGDYPMIGLGGQTPASATIAVGSTANITLAVPDADVGVIGADGAAVAILGLAGGADVMLSAVDPSVAKFHLVNFTIGNLVDATDPNSAAATACDDITSAGGNTCVLTPGFGVASIGFSIGATIVTDVDSGAAFTAYQPTTYTGSFDVTASY